ncbi:DNA alkylation repair protein [Bacillaceae bacterium Marseille-Q3522]|nr:DNA alkylation repair protein [Bacillaceae bacterium Marseille-Q3522]
MDIFAIYYENKNEEKAVKMAAYMKNNFPFLGIAKPERVKITKDFFKQRKKDKQIDWEFIFTCYEMPEREFHYLAISYLSLVRKLLVKDDIGKIEKLIVKNSWWDSVDSLDEITGYMCLQYPELKEAVIMKWVASDNIWLKRVAIDFQLQYKEKTDPEMLKKAILYNCDTNEFFVNKAIGWSLREYSKTNKEWVKQFLREAEEKLSPLSVREASKYL